MKVSSRLTTSLLFASLLMMGAGSAQTAEKFAYDGPPIALRFSHFAPETHPMSKAVSQKWIEMVEKESNGKIKIQAYLGGVLHSAKDGFKAAVNDITDFTPAYTMYKADSFQLTHVLDLPFAFPSAAVAVKVAEELYPKYFKKEYEAMGVYIANYNANGSYNLFTKKPVAKLEDLKEMKIRAAGGEPSRIMKALGAVPVASSLFHRPQACGRAPGSRLTMHPRRRLRRCAGMLRWKAKTLASLPTSLHPGQSSRRWAATQAVPGRPAARSGCRSTAKEPHGKSPMPRCSCCRMNRRSSMRR